MLRIFALIVLVFFFKLAGALAFMLWWLIVTIKSNASSKASGVGCGHHGTKGDKAAFEFKGRRPGNFNESSANTHAEVNPANGMPMFDDFMDVGGGFFGVG